MSDLCQDAQDVEARHALCPTAQEAMGLYLALNRPELKRAIDRYASEHRISMSTAVAEACRSYFLGE